MRGLAGMGISALPCAGGILDQPEGLMDDINVCAVWYEAMERKKEPKQ